MFMSALFRDADTHYMYKLLPTPKFALASFPWKKREIELKL